MLTDDLPESNKVLLAELEAWLEEKDLECQQSSLDGAQEPPLKRRAVWNAAAYTAKKPACHAEQDCNSTEDTCCLFFPGPRGCCFLLLHSFQRGLHRKYIEHTRKGGGLRSSHLNG